MPYQYRYRPYLTVGHLRDGRLAGIISDGTPQLGHSPITVLDVEIVASEGHAKEWYQQALKTEPWAEKEKSK